MKRNILIIRGIEASDFEIVSKIVKGIDVSLSLSRPLPLFILQFKR
jgi:hypothetical protein